MLRRRIHGQVHSGKVFIFQKDRILGLVEYDSSWKDKPHPSTFKLINLKGEVIDSSATFKHMKSVIVPKHLKMLQEIAGEKRRTMTLKSIRRVVKEKLTKRQERGMSR